MLNCGEKDIQTESDKESLSDKDTLNCNLIVFVIPGYDNQVHSLLKKDINALSVSKLNAIGSYSTDSYFDSYSDINANISALMSGKTTLNGLNGIDKDSSILKSWYSLFKTHNYHTGIITNGRLGNNILGPIINGNYRESKSQEENIAYNIIKNRPNFIWGMGIKLFDSRIDKKNVFNEMSISNYHLNFKLNNTTLPEFDYYAGIFNNYLVPDSVDLIENGLSLWNKHRSRSKKNFSLIVTINNLQSLIETQNPQEVFIINSYLDKVFKYVELESENTLVMIINPFLNFDRTFNYASKDSLNVNSSPRKYNYLDNNIWAYGKYSNQFIGNYRNIDLYDKMARLIKK
jgi:hypothetical protein